MDYIPETTYQAAKAISGAVEAHFARQITLAQQQQEDHLASQIPMQTIEAIIDATFWASLLREEGHFPKISLAYLHPSQTAYPLLFEHRYSLSPEVLIKLAPAVERPGIHIGVWSDADGLYIWGTTRIIPNLCFVLEVVEPGMLVIKHRNFHGFGKFVNVAVLHGGQVKMIDKRSARQPDCPSLLTSLLGLNASWNGSVNVLVQLAASMRSHQRGGSLLVVPAGTHTWSNSVIYPIKYAISPVFSGLTSAIPEHRKPQPSEVNLLDKQVESMAGLTAVDGATLINDHYELLAFGIKIKRSAAGTPVEQVLVTEPVVGNEATVIHPSQSGGTRHLSAAQFVHDQHDALALVASQDGRFTVFTWSADKQMVQAHRIESLLM